MKRFRFGKSERLRKRREFLDVSRRASQRLNTGNFLILLKTNQLPQPRLGITVTKKVGSAVTRNRIKRNIREFFRLNQTRLPRGHDIVVIAHPGAAGLDYHDLQEELKRILDRPRR